MDPLRLFIAVDPPPALRQEIADAVAIARARLSGFRWTPPENLHLTLRFLGEVAADRQGEVEEGIAALVPGWRPLLLNVTAWGAFPGLKQARVVWLGVGGEAAHLAPMARGLNILPAGAPPETRVYQPHLTVARSRPGTAVAPAELARLPIPVTPWPIEAVHLYTSILTREGACYRIVRSYPLVALSS